MAEQDQSAKAPRSLDDADITTESTPSTRRSALAVVGAAIATAVFGAVVATPSEAEACRRRTGVTDRDPSDGVGRGHTGLTDSDSGDEARCGRGSTRRVRRSCTDSDGGRYADRPGRGRRCY
ncbi:MAG: hypothetical protein JNK72_15445 [Myxococcales bacterium]|nr:hypothetical protein [Myxococcales bacterium]